MKKVYLTFDMDWASDDVMKYFYEKIYFYFMHMSVLPACMSMHQVPIETREG